MLSLCIFHIQRPRYTPGWLKETSSEISVASCEVKIPATERQVPRNTHHLAPLPTIISDQIRSLPPGATGMCTSRGLLYARNNLPACLSFPGFHVRSVYQISQLERLSASCRCHLSGTRSSLSRVTVHNTAIACLVTALHAMLQDSSRMFKVPEWDLIEDPYCSARPSLLVGTGYMDFAASTFLSVT